MVVNDRRSPLSFEKQTNVRLVGDNEPRMPSCQPLRAGVMRALVCHGPRDFRLEQRPVPVPAAGEVLLRPLFNGICFTDKHVYEGHVARAPGRVIRHELRAGRGAGPGVGDWRSKQADRRHDTASLRPPPDPGGVAVQREQREHTRRR
jgi:hypothetical protein